LYVWVIHLQADIKLTLYRHGISTCVSRDYPA
jgi:hypothetical protein